MSKINNSRPNKTEYRLPVAELYPGLTPEEQQEVEYFLTQYLEIIYRIYRENEDLTESDLNTTV